MPTHSEIKMGIYRHYKGGLYQVLGLAHDANGDELCVMVARITDEGGEMWTEHLGERTVVVYMPLQLDSEHVGPRMAVRTLEDFTADIENGGATGMDRSNLCESVFPDDSQVKCAKYLGHGSTDDQHRGWPGVPGKSVRWPVQKRFTYLGPVLTEEML